ncbi:methyltransferase domain-containing protein [Streptomyces sp. P9(2023)]|uniref:methyltransferase domain-containing protein n=1 Tax=Streptomyces sp. P9(2023) TaxID=3064394 RepID=UPI0028F45BF6|nr:methyltransferase domain-containing protein [Streptomyces sp. P9(2023)]MDT9690292.1 methyltransferase domain-containing protein [Streptomyces sp. P9(2023)]
MGAQPDGFAEDGARARRALVREIEAYGALRDPAWHAAFSAVPRHLFVPSYYVSGAAGYERLWSGDPDPARRARWLRGAYRDVPLATRVRDGELVTSSSQPSLMAQMLEALDVRDGHDVLEIGAGTGYNAALLSHRLGAEHVTTVDIDAEITDSARVHLAAAGHRPTVITGDGARGCPGRAPFDRIVATCTLPSVPYAWLAQCRPDALVLTPLSTGLLLLRVDDAGHAEGRFLATAAYFVALRGGNARFPRGRPMGLPRHIFEDDRFQFLRTLAEGTLDAREALALWQRERRPERERFGVTVSEGRQWAWLDDPTGPYAWPLPSD